MCKVKSMCKIVIYKGSKSKLFCGQKLEMRRHLVVHRPLLVCIITIPYNYR